MEALRQALRSFQQRDGNGSIKWPLTPKSMPPTDGEHANVQAPNSKLSLVCVQ